MSEQYSLTRAIAETLEGGIPFSKPEREFHFSAERAFQEVRSIAALRTTSGGKFRTFFAPLSILLRDLSVSGEGSAKGKCQGSRSSERSGKSAGNAITHPRPLTYTHLLHRR